jgi:hypothetical protein
LASVASLVGLFLLRATAFEGFPAGSGGDAGNHIWKQREFATGEWRGDSYGMVTLYALGHWISVAGLGDDLVGFRVSWQLALIACMSLGVGVAILSTQITNARALRWAFGGVALLSIAVPAFFVALPRLHYYQGDGFLTQEFSVVPLSVGVGMYAVASRRLVRVLILIATLGFYRFTYLLNLGDLALASGVMLLAELLAAPRRRGVRWTLAVGAAGCLVAAVFAYVRIVAILPTNGGFRQAPLEPQLIGLAVLTVLFAGVGPACRYWGAPCPPAVERLARFLAVLCAAPTLLVSAWLLSGQTVEYYVHKYAFTSIVLGSLCALPVALGAAFRLVARGGTPLAGVAASALVVGVAAGLFGLASSANVYAPDFRERFARPPYRHLLPHADRTVWRIIDRTLRREHAQFGGFLTPRWAESQFTNAHYAVKTSREDIFRGHTIYEPGHCVFWYENDMLPRSLQAAWPANVLSKVNILQSSESTRCETFTPTHAPRSRLSLCFRCNFPRHTRLVPLTSATDGFYGVESASDGTAFRWTNGKGRVGFTVSKSEAGRVCDLRVDSGSGRPFELRLDDQRLGMGPRQVLPVLVAGDAHQIQIRSETFVPAQDTRVLGVAVKSIALDCID